MQEVTFESLLNAAKEAGGGTADVLLPKGSYAAEVIVTNSKRSTKGKLTIGLKLKVTEPGPYEGAGFWDNLYLSPESPAALDIFFRTFEALGLPRDAWGKYGADLDAAGVAAAEAVKGAKVKVSVDQEEWPKGSGTLRNVVKGYSKLAGAPDVPAAPAPTPAAAEPATAPPPPPF